MLDAVDKAYKTYNEGRLAFRQYFATCGPNVKQNDPRMPPNPHVGHCEGLAWLYGFESELRRHVVFNPSTRVPLLIAAFEGLVRKSWVLRLQPLVMTERQNDRR